MNLLDELKKRKVFRVAAVYAVVAWLARLRLLHIGEIREAEALLTAAQKMHTHLGSLIEADS